MNPTIAVLLVAVLVTLAILRHIRRAAELQHITLQSILDASMHAAIVITDVNGLITTFNTGAERILGYAAAEVVGKPVRDYVDYLSLVQDGREMPLRRKDGVSVMVKAVRDPLKDRHGRIRGYLGIFRDVREGSRPESVEARLYGLLEAAPNAEIVVDTKGLVVFCNREAERIFGYSRTELLGRSVDVLVAENLRTRHAALRTNYTVNPLPRPMGSGMDLSARRKDGTLFPVEISLGSLDTPEGVLVVAAIADITRRKQAEEEVRRLNRELEQRVAERTTDLRTANTALRETEEKITRLNADLEERVLERTRELESARDEAHSLYRRLHEQASERIRHQAALIDQANDAILLRDMEDKIVFWNKGAERLYGWTVEEALNRNAIELLSCDPLLATEANRCVAETGRWTGELPQTTRSGKRIVVSSSWTRLNDEEGKPQSKLIINADITERKSLQARLIQAQRLEAVALLVGGVAHDFNNLLTVINGYSSLLLRNMDPLDPMYKRLTEIQKAGAWGTSLTRQLLAFCRKQILEPRVLNLNAVVEDFKPLLLKLAGEAVEVSTNLSPECGPVLADAGQLEQVLMNLASNARDAMPDGGSFIVETRNVEVDEVTAHRHPGARPGPFVLLSVIDNGTGMTEEIQKHLFEPFFTTKESGKGTGLGLASVRGIVEQSGGWIHVVSEVNRGTVFDIYLPRVDAAVPERKAPAIAGPPLHGTETILVAEDLDAVRGLACDVLRGCGYQVLESASGADALVLAESRSGPIHLLLTDIVMAGMNGRELATRLQAGRPGLRTLFMSGYADKVIENRGVLEDGLAYIAKPFMPEALVEKVREVLGQTPPGRSGEHS